MNAYNSSSSAAQQQQNLSDSDDTIEPFREIHWIGLCAEVLIFCCSFISCGGPSYRSGILALGLFFFLLPLGLACAEREESWNVLLATACVISLLQATLFVDRMIHHYHKPIRTRDCCFTFWFNMLAIATMAVVICLTVAANRYIIWIVMVVVSWIIILAQVMVVWRFVWMMDERRGGGPMHFDLIERQQAFCAAMTLASILYTLVPCLEFEPNMVAFVCPMIGLVTGAFGCHSTSMLKEHTIVSSGSFVQSGGNGGPVTVVVWAVIITLPPCILLITISFRISVDYELILMIGFFFFTAVFSDVVCRGPLRWSVVIAKDVVASKNDVKLPNEDAVVVVVETVTMLCEHQVVHAYRGIIPEHKKKSNNADASDPNVYHLSDKEVPRVVLVTPERMVEMTPDDPIGFHRTVEEALARLRHKSASGDHYNGNQESTASGTTILEIL